MLESRQDVRIRVQRNRNLRVSRPLRYERHGHAFQQEKGGARVLEVMYADRRHASPLHNGLEVPQDVSWIQDMPIARAEHQIVVLPERCALAAERLSVLV